MHSTSNKNWKKTTQSQQNGTAKKTSASHWIGTTSEGKCTFHFLATSRRLSSSSATNNRKRKSSISKRPSQVWIQKAKFHTTISGTTSGQEGKEIYSTNMWNFFVSRKSGRQHPSVPNQRDCIPIYESNQKHNETNTTTVRSHHDSKRSNTNVQRRRHETRITQRGQLPEQAKKNNSSRRSLLFIQRSNDTTKQRRNY